ncbi:MAG: hypothetical protein U9Q96_01485 [Patescibacteria group bacterium]|nr:hypothetical protein [Patescibacteria group bacterium]
MESRQMVLVSDIDGTIIYFSLPFKVHQWMSSRRAYLIPFLLILPLAYLLYLLRPRKKSAKSRICKHKQDGGRVVIFSATEDMVLTRIIIKAWLKLWRVPYDLLALRPHGLGIKEFKLRILEEEVCDILLENNIHLVDYLIRERERRGVEFVSKVRETRYSVVRFRNI